MKTTLLLSTAASLALPLMASAGTIAVSAPFTDEASTGISSANTYTHALSGGSAQTVNGVSFDRSGPGVAPANFSWTASTPGFNQLTNNFGQWNPVAGLAGTNTEALLRDFTFMGDGANPGNSQTFTLSGLTVGSAYSARLYVRVWTETDAPRSQTVTFTHGLESDTFLDFQEDRPALMVPGANPDDAYYLGYDFIAQATELSINTEVSPTAPAGSGSFHMYALSNQVVPEPSSLALLGLGLAALLRRRRR